MTDQERRKQEEADEVAARSRFAVKTYTIKDMYAKFYWVPAFNISAGHDCRGHAPGSIESVRGSQP